MSNPGRSDGWGSLKEGSNSGLDFTYVEGHGVQDLLTIDGIDQHSIGIVKDDIDVTIVMERRDRHLFNPGDIMDP